jgi:hypothetical protein
MSYGFNSLSLYIEYTKKHVEIEYFSPTFIQLGGGLDKIDIDTEIDKQITRVVTRIKEIQVKERVKYEPSVELQLLVTLAEIYDVGDNSHWLRLKVENQTALQIQNCYGKLLGRRQLASMLTRENGKFFRPRLSQKVGRKSSEHMQLPPEGHRFPWSPTNRLLTTVNISKGGSFEFLYLVTKRNDRGCFWFPSSIGNDYENWSIGDFEMELEIGADDKAIKPTKVSIKFRVEGGDIGLLKWKVLAN